LANISQLCCRVRSTTKQFVLAPRTLRHTTSNFFQLNPCGRSLYITSSLTRGWVCCIQLLLGLASAVILRSESRENHDQILLSQIQDSSNLDDKVSVFLFQGNRMVQLNTQSLSSLFVVSHDAQRYGGGFRPGLHIVAPRHASRRKHGASIVVEVCFPRRFITSVAARTT
jgi:hypothetical protein